MKPSLGSHSPPVLEHRLRRQPHPPHHTASGFVYVELAIETIMGYGFVWVEVEAETIWGRLGIGGSTGLEIEDCDWIHGVDKDDKKDEFPRGFKGFF
ncbi:hypothetical protein C1H46_029356 [Malus baccata]|uniref:Uncharacterized protein n=1 Tax=Malus baccata TaxID=106549 RepID=A0A540LFK8_MALBA|nr:hypothetical protein C1H46_029356 [Malus baccata]